MNETFDISLNIETILKTGHRISFKQQILVSNLLCFVCLNKTQAG